jgi:hypothetical protein
MADAPRQSQCGCINSQQRQPLYCFNLQLLLALFLPPYAGEYALFFEPTFTSTSAKKNAKANITTQPR